MILSVFMFFSMLTAANALAEQKIPGPPLAQSLVREGTLAVNLANALKIGSPANEAEAESALTSAGIAPRNGWIGDYPVTPDVVIELRNAVGSAADAKGLSMSKEEALNVFDNVTKDYELPVSAANAGPTVSPNTSLGTEPPAPTVINNYYAQEGPPVVTYYAPPADYSYLYNYVPYPFWWLNALFQGYYILADFIFPLYGYGWWQHGYWGGYGYGYWGGYGRYGYWGGYGYNHWSGYDHDGHHDGHGGHGNDRYAVSNHYRHPDGGATHRIEPASRAYGGVSDGNRAGGQRWTNPAAQRSAGAIYNRSSHVNTARDSVNMRPPVNNRTGYNRGDNLNSGRSVNAPARSYSANRSINQPAQRASYQTRQSTNSPGRTGYNRGDNLNSGRSVNAPARSYSANRSINQPAQRASYQTRQSTYSPGRTGYNRGDNLNSGRSVNAPARSYSANRSINQPAQRASSYQARQNMYSSGRGGVYKASFVANSGQFGGGGRSSSSGHGSYGGSFSGRGSFGGGGHGQGGRR